ncbi:MAG: ABC transporter ATP-binding protein [Thermoplasmatota archaeon]
MLLDAQGVRAGYDDLEILQGVAVRVAAGEIVALIGPNGAGKSTLAKAIFGLLPVRDGRVFFRGSDVTRLKPEVRARLGMGYVPQLQNVFLRLTVRENLEMGSFAHSESPADAIERVLSIFGALRPRLAERVSRLSGGQRQMVAIGRALMPNPTLLILDEPSAGLAPAVQAEIFNVFAQIAAQGTAILLVEQNARRALALAHRGYVLEHGVNKYEGPGSDLLRDPNVGRLYLGGEAAESVR